MRSYIKERTIKEAEYILDNKCSIRTAAKYFNVSKSTLHYDLQKRLKLINIELFEKIQIIFNVNSKMKHIRGGISTKLKYLSLKKEENV